MLQKKKSWKKRDHHWSRDEEVMLRKVKQAPKEEELISLTQRVKRRQKEKNKHSRYI